MAHVRDLFAGRTPHALYQRFRNEAPVYWSKDLRAWLIFNYSDICEVLSNTAHFISEPVTSRGASSGEPLDGMPNILLSKMGISTIANCDSPQHAELREGVRSRLSPVALKSLREPTRERAARLVTEAFASGQVELVEEIARPLALSGILQMMNIDDSHRFLLGRYAAYVRDGTQWGEQCGARDAAIEATRALSAFLAPIMRERSANPGEDLISALASRIGRSAGARFDDMLGTAVVLLVAGHETTKSLMAAAVERLAAAPDVWRALASAPPRIAGALEEVARLESPVQCLIRFCKREAIIGGRRIGTGQTVLLMLAAANRDPTRFERPDEFDPERQVRGHLAYGSGDHVCPGAAIGKMEAKILLAELLRQFPEKPPTLSESVWSSTIMFRGPARLCILRSGEGASTA